MRGGAAKGLAILFAVIILGLVIPAVLNLMHLPGMQKYLSDQSLPIFLIVFNIFFIGGFLLFLVKILGDRHVRI